MKRFVCHINNFLKVNMRVGELLAVTGVLLLVVLLGACEAEIITEEEADGVEYTDIEYSESGSEVTVYLDGVGVPVTRSQRAITKDLAQTAFDFIEVIFVNGNAATPTNVVRTSWILGQPANILNVDRGAVGGTGVNYANIYPAANGPAACMFVGRDDGKILLGVGRLTGSRNEDGTAGTTTLTPDTRSVTFSLAALQTGLLVGEETAPADGVADSLKYYINTSDPDQGGYTTRDGDNSFRKTLGGIDYPVYCLPIGNSSAGIQVGDPSSIITYMMYDFYFITNPGGTWTDSTTTYLPAVRHDKTISDPPSDTTTVKKRTPRFFTGGRYYEPKNLIDSLTRVSLRSAYTTTAGNQFNNSVRLRFSSGAKKGLFSFNIQIPVYMVSKTNADRNNGSAAVVWTVRTGVGSELYSLDNGLTRGGCVLMATGLTAEEFDSVEWTWFKGF